MNISAARYAVMLGALGAAGCYTSHATEAAHDGATGDASWTRPPWPGPGPAPDPCGTFAPAFQDPTGFAGERWMAGPADPFVFFSNERQCARWGAPACVLPDCGPEHVEGSGSAVVACWIEPNELREYAGYRESAASSWCFFATREQCECACLGRC